MEQSVEKGSELPFCNFIFLRLQMMLKDGQGPWGAGGTEVSLSS